MSTATGKPIFSLGSYQVLSELGRGHHSVVYLAQKEQKLFAIKIPSAEATANESCLQRFRRESDALARLNHPNLIRVEEIGEENGKPFLVMEYLRGQALSTKLQSQSPLPFDEVIRIGRDVAKALCEIHRNQLIHRDVKPENIMICEDGSVRLIDLEMIGSEDDLQFDQELNVVVGSFSYMSPEQAGIFNRLADARSDLYSLGVSLYEMATGDLPFAGNSINEILKCHASQIPVPASLRRPGLPEAFSEILSKLLRKDPDDRYQSATGLIYDFENLERIQNLGLRDGFFNLGARDFALSRNPASLQGRQNELQTVIEALEKSRNRKSKWVFIEGESGMGKSRLVQEALMEFDASQSLFLQVKCNDKSVSHPFRAIRESLNSLLDPIRTYPQKKQELLQFLQRAGRDLEGGLSRVLPAHLCSLVLAQTPNSPAAPIEIAEISQEQVVAQVLEFFLRIADSYHLLLWVDDIQWADEASVQLLQNLQAQAEQKTIGAIFTLRKESKQSFKNHEPGRKMLDSPHTLLVPVQALSPSEEGELIRQLLGRREVSPSLLETISKTAVGNPLLIQEITLSLFEAGEIQLKGGAWVLEQSAVSAAIFSSHAYRIILSRALQLKEAHREALARAAVIGNSFDADTLAYLMDSSRMQVEECLQDCIRIHFIEWDSRRKTYAFTHDKIRESILEGLEREQLLETNGRLAEYLQEKVRSFPELILDLAQAHRLSNWRNCPENAFEANLKAGQKLLEQYSYKEARQVLEFAEKVCEEFECTASDRFLLFSLQGKANQNLGQHEEAFRFFAKARPFAGDPLERTLLEILEFKNYYSAGKVHEAWQQMKVCVHSLGSSFPDTSFGLVCGILFNLLRTYLMVLFPIRWARYRGRGHERKMQKARMMADILDVALMNAYVLGAPLETAYITVRSFTVSFPLGDSPEMVKAHYGVASAWSLVPIRKLMHWHLKRADNITRKLGDPGLRTRFELQKMWCLEFSGATREAEQLGLELIPRVKRYLSSEAISNCLGDIAAQYMNRGMFRECVQFILQYLPEIDRTQNMLIMSNTRGMLYCAGNWLGGIEKMDDYFQEYLQLIRKIPATNFTQVSLPSNLIAVYFDGEKIDQDLERVIEDFYRCGLEDHHFKISHIEIAYIRLWQYDHAASEKDRGKALRVFRKSIRALVWRASIPLWKCHLYVLKAALARIERKFLKAEKWLDLADEESEKAGSQFGLFMAAWERIRLAQARGQNLRVAKEAKHAYEMALKYGIRNKARYIDRDYRVTSDRSAHNTPVSRSEPERMTLNQKRVLNSLLQISQATVTTADPAGQIRAVLDEILTVFGAERGYVLNWSEASHELKFAVGRHANGSDLEGLVDHSSSAIRTVLETKQPLVTAGCEKFQGLSSLSAITHDLRSVLCVPLFLKESFQGVLYIDSRLSRGLFGQEDVNVLSAIASHIAIALESTRLAAVEAEKRELSKDLEVSAAIQEMLLPEKPYFQDARISLVSLYKPAVRCGGDWWWYSRRAEDLMVFVGDITGHGVGSAMLATSVAAIFRYYERNQVLDDMGRALKEINQDFSAFTKGEYLMTGMALKLDLTTYEMSWWSVGGPSLILQKKDGTVRPVGAPGSPLGMGESFKIPPSHGVVALNPGDRVIVATDGIGELILANGNLLGERQFGRILKSLQAVPIAQLPEKLWLRLSEISPAECQRDDITFVALEIPVAGGA